MARAGMSSLIELVRGLTNAGTAEATVAGINYWSNEHLEEALDRRRIDHYREQLEIQPVTHPDAVVKYFDYYWDSPHVEEAASGTLVWSVTDSVGATRGTALYEVNYEARHIRFTADQQGTLLYLSYRSYDVYRVASDVWRRKAGHVAAKFDFSTDNHKISRSQLFKSYMDAAKLMDDMGGARSVTMVRDDLLHIERTRQPF